MVKRSKTKFQGFDSLKLENGSLELWMTTSTGPRVLGLSAYGGENMLAVLPDATIENPGQDTFYLRGGHRLWYAPEKPETTYIQDNQPVEVIEVESGVELVQPVDQPTGVQKSIKIVLSESKAEVKLSHCLTNTGDTPIDLAPWAITQLRIGGVGIFPQQTSLDDSHGLLPNRHIVLWPYTKINSPYIHWGDEAIFIEANVTESMLKIGFPNPAGWMGYALEGALFVKRAKYDFGATYLDRQASSQSYCCEKFIELETLGPYVTLQQGEMTLHKETWEVYAAGEWPGEITALYREYSIGNI